MPGRMKTRTTSITPQTKTLTRFRCVHCGNRLIMQNRHLRRLVACHACGKPTHPAMRRMPPAVAPGTAQKLFTVVQASAKSEQTPAPAPAPVAAPARPIPRSLELSIAPLAPVILIGATGAAFYAALSFMTYLGGFASALMLVAAAAVGLRWIRRGTTSVRVRLEQIDATRARYGSLRVVSMMFAWLWSQPPRRKPWAVLLMVFWGAVYGPYCVTGMFLPSPRRQLARVAA